MQNKKKEMKKASNNSAIASNYAQFIGKTYQLSKHNVCVEDVIAEGIRISKMQK